MQVYVRKDKDTGLDSMCGQDFSQACLACAIPLYFCLFPFAKNAESTLNLPFWEEPYKHVYVDQQMCFTYEQILACEDTVHIIQCLRRYILSA